MEGPLGSRTDLNGNAGYIALRTAHAISESEAPRRFNTALISSFAAIAVLLAVLGIYSVIAFSVALRVQEMAVGMALAHSA
jgi:putative ABC transport system permease protein